MKNFSFLHSFVFSVLLILFSFSDSFARRGPPPGGARRGGLGFLFEDFGGFSNPAQKAHFRGFAAEVQYETVLNTAQKTITPSLLWGGGSFGIGGFVSRSGTSPEESTDSLGGTVGLGLASNRITLGVGYARSIDAGQVTDGTLTASMNYNGLGGKGFHLGVGGSTTVNRAGREIKTGTAAIGWGFGRTVLEAIYTIKDLSDPAATCEYSGFLAGEGQSFFGGVGGGYDKVTSALFGAGRLGVKLGKMDLSIFGNKSFASGNTTSVGGSLRVKF